MTNALEKSDLALIGELKERIATLRANLRTRIVGMEDVIDHLLYSLFSGGHSLLIGVPGLAKTLLISSLAQSFSLDFNRIQFTPDLMPSDITGADIITVTEESRDFTFRRGPIFANIILADEINRTPPKTQAALMEAMEESQISCGGHTYKLDEPFFVLATQNPIEQEGTYPLPVAQLDRFMFSLQVDYPTVDEEYEILRKTTSSYRSELEPIFTREHVMEARALVRRITAREEVLRYALGIVRATRGKRGSPAFIREWLNWGCGPRATQAVILGAKARAMTLGRTEAEPEDVRAVVPAVLRHRAIVTYHAESEGLATNEIIQELIESVESPDGYGTAVAEKGFFASLWG